MVKIDAASTSAIEWKFAPAQHPGAKNVRLLYRKTADTLSNSFLTALPPSFTGALADADILARIFSPDACNPKMLNIYQGWVIARLEDFRFLKFYMAALYRNASDTSDVGSIWRIADGTFSREITGMLLGDKVDWRKPWCCRFNLNGPALKAKWWSYDVPEPLLWDLRGTDNTITKPGLMGFASTVHGGISENVWGLDWYAWSANPAFPAPSR